MNSESRKATFDLLGDLIATPTRAHRRGVMILSSLCLLVALTGVIPDEVAVLGIKFPGLDQHFLNWALLVVAGFTNISFWVHLACDFTRVRLLQVNYDEALRAEIHAAIVPPEVQEEEDYHFNSYIEESGVPLRTVSRRKALWLVRLKTVLDFGIPLVYGIAALSIFIALRF